MMCHPIHTYSGGLPPQRAPGPVSGTGSETIIIRRPGTIRARTTRFRPERRFSEFIRDDSASDDDVDGMSEDEEEDFDVVDFAAESKEDGGAADLLRRFTHIEDVASEGVEEMRRAMEGMDTALEASLIRIVLESDICG
jgi:hypothetical protein